MESGMNRRAGSVQAARGCDGSSGVRWRVSGAVASGRPRRCDGRRGIAGRRGSSPRLRAPVMSDVGRLAGVSHQTVSRVINGSPHVRPETRARVLAAMEELGYRPNPVARALVTGRSKMLGVVSFDTTLYGPASTLFGIERAAHEAGYFIIVASLEDAQPLFGAGRGRAPAPAGRGRHPGDRARTRRRARRCCMRRPTCRWWRPRRGRRTARRWWRWIRWPAR